MEPEQFFGKKTGVFSAGQGERRRGRKFLNTKIIFCALLLPVLSVSALALQEPSTGDWLKVRFLFDEIGIQKYDLRMESAINYMRDNGLGDTSSLEEILGEFRDAAADLEAYTRSKDPDEETYNSTRDELYEIVTEFREESQKQVPDEEERELVREAADQAIAKKMDKFEEMADAARDELEYFFLSAFDYHVDKIGDVLEDIGENGMDVSEFEEDLEDIEDMRPGLVEVLQNHSRDPGPEIREVSAELSELYLDINDSAHEYWAALLVEKIDEAMENASVFIEKIKQNASREGVELDLAEEEEELGNLVEDLRGVRELLVEEKDVEKAVEMIEDEITPKYKQVFVRVQLKIYSAFIDVIIGKIDEGLEEFEKNMSEKGIQIEYDDILEEVEDFKKELEGLKDSDIEDLDEAGKDLEKRTKKFLDSIAGRVIMRVYLYVKDAAFEKMHDLMDELEANASRDGLSVDFSEAEEELEDISEMFEELQDLVDDGKVEEAKEMFEEEVKPRYEQVGLKIRTAVIDAMADKLIVQTKQTIRDLEKNLSQWNLSIDLEEEEDELDGFAEELKEIKVLVREGKINESEERGKELGEEIKEWHNKVAAKIWIQISEQRIELTEDAFEVWEKLGKEDDVSDFRELLSEVEEQVEVVEQLYEDGDYEEARNEAEKLEGMWNDFDKELKKKMAQWGWGEGGDVI